LWLAYVTFGRVTAILPVITPSAGLHEQKSTFNTVVFAEPM
jgi:hypothetical protein